MNKKISPTLVGAFVVGALLLLVFALLNFGAGGLFREPRRFVVAMRQTSVSGLEPGSTVKFSGVRVGRVESVHARFNPDAGEVVVRVICDIDEKDAAELFPDAETTGPGLIERLVARGLQAKLSFAGITGLLYLDLLINREATEQTVAHDAETGAPIVPLAPSRLAEFTETLSTIADNLAQVDFPGISSDLRRVLGNLDAVIKDVDLRGAVARVGSAADSVERLAADENLRTAFANLNRSTEELRALLADVRAGVPRVETDLRQTLTEAATAMKALSASADEIQALLGPRGGLSEEVGRTLAALRRSAEGVEQLVDYLERNPSALLRGRVDWDEVTPRKP
jgi:paraquat-inducible protein B